MGFYSAGNNYGKITEILAGSEIQVTNLSDTIVDRFLVDHVPAEQLSVGLTLVDKEATVERTNPVLWGRTIDEIQLDWVYNHTITTQTLTNNGGLTPPVLGPNDVQHIYTGQAIQNTDVDFTIAGDDGGNFGSLSLASDIEGIEFGNYRVWGVGERYDYNKASAPDLWDDNDLITFLEDLLTTSGTKELKTVRVKTNLFGEGGELEHFYYFYPKRWGFATFEKYNFVGGLVRLKRNAADKIEPATDFYAYDAGEQDIMIDNGVATDAFLVYMSVNDQQDDDTEPILVT